MPAFNGIICPHLVHLLDGKTGTDFTSQWQQIRAMMAADPCGCIACRHAEAEEDKTPTPRTSREVKIYERAFRAGQQDIKAQVNRNLGPAPTR